MHFFGQFISLQHTYPLPQSPTPLSRYDKPCMETLASIMFRDIFGFDIDRKLPRLLAINLMKVEIKIFQTVMRPHVNHLIKVSSLATSYATLAPCLVWY